MLNVNETQKDLSWVFKHAIQLMLIELITLFVEACTTILVAACLLRFYLHYLKINFSPASGNPFSHFLHPLTNWILTPLGKVFRFGSRFDFNALLASYLLVLSKTILLLSLNGQIGINFATLIIALFNLFDLALSGLIGLLLVYVIFSWTQTHSPTQALFDEMIEPLLKPIRKISPSVSGVDLSTLILVLLIQMTKIILEHLQAGILANL
jgi:YggT family protein